MPMSTEPISTQVTLSIVISYVIELLKKSPRFKLISENTYLLNRVIAVIVSGATAAGVHFTSLHTAEGGYVFTLTVLNASSVTACLLAWVKSFVFQEIAYQKLIKSSPKQEV